MARTSNNGAQIAGEPATPANRENPNVAQVHKALGRLSASGREVIHLHYFSGLSYDEIASALGISPQAVHGRMQRARRWLAKQLSVPD
jgi:RNA polymerase sigma-70 factor (ECF subfamily)